MGQNGPAPKLPPGFKPVVSPPPPPRTKSPLKKDPPKPEEKEDWSWLPWAILLFWL